MINDNNYDNILEICKPFNTDMYRLVGINVVQSANVLELQKFFLFNSSKIKFILLNIIYKIKGVSTKFFFFFFL